MLAKPRGLPLNRPTQSREPARRALVPDRHPMKRCGMVIGLRAEKLDEYKRLHAAVWPDVLRRIRECHIRNYSIYLRRLDDGQFYLFSYFEYVGDDFAADMAKMAADPLTQEWWKECIPCQQPVESAGPNDWWTNMEELFHRD